MFWLTTGIISGILCILVCIFHRRLHPAVWASLAAAGGVYGIGAIGYCFGCKECVLAMAGGGLCLILAIFYIAMYVTGNLEEKINLQAAWSCNFSEVCEEVHCSWSDKYNGKEGLLIECLLENDAARRRRIQEKE